MERTLYAMEQRGELPYWLMHPNDRHIRDDAAAAADGFTDPGNMVLDTLVHALRLWQYCDASKASLVVRQSGHEYGHRANRSSAGPVNLRGNIVEAMSRNLQQTGSKMPRQRWKNSDPYWYYWTQDVMTWAEFGQAEEQPPKRPVGAAGIGSEEKGQSPGRGVLHVLPYCGSSCTAHVTRIFDTRVNGHACEPSVWTSGKPV